MKIHNENVSNPILVADLVYLSYETRVFSLKISSAIFFRDQANFTDTSFLFCENKEFYSGILTDNDRLAYDLLNTF